MASKCDIVRDTAAAFRCGLCCRAPPCPAAKGCPAAATAAACLVPKLANRRMALFAAKYAPPSDLQRAELQTHVNAVADLEAQLAAAYPGGAVDISWPDFEKCEWGAGANIYGNKRFRREDLTSFGLDPPYPLGGHALEGRVWSGIPGVGLGAAPIPVAADYLVNPDLLTVFVLGILLLIVLGVALGLMLRGQRRRWKKGASPRTPDASPAIQT